MAKKLITICVVYADRSGPPMNPNYPFIHSTQVVVESDEDVRQTIETLVKPILADGYQILNQLLIITPDEMISAVAGVQSGA